MSEIKANPIPQGKYVPATRFGNIIVTAGMTPRKNGQLIQTGRVEKDAPLENYKDAVRQAADNALTAASNQLEEGERIARVMSMTVYINAEEGFTAHAKLADFASDFLNEVLGDASPMARVSVGVATLPGNAPVEIQLMCGVGQ
ncbi:MAG: RidA family protein [Firmicutes bacterium]|nr:RidA family protein [Bacillota bacterium]MBR3034552.1 RidA family protein [Bacillota bacterium]MBR3749148.1 RidA family protein [Bacillota bacterium]MBR4143461.1 RidA family protein [Bacillota bacterium]